MKNYFKDMTTSQLKVEIKEAFRKCEPNSHEKIDMALKALSEKIPLKEFSKFCSNL